MSVVLDDESVVSCKDVDGSGVRSLAVLKEFGEHLVDSVAKEPFDTGPKTIGVDEDCKL